MTQGWQAAVRAAVGAMMWQLPSTDEYFRPQLVRFESEITDDFCLSFEWIERAGVADAVLACAATEAAAEVSAVARLMYGARLLLRSAGLAVPSVRAPSNGVQVGCPTFAGAIETARKKSVRCLGAPRPLLEGLRGYDESAGSALLRVLSAAFSDDPEVLVLALCHPPYSLDATAVRLALGSVDGQGNRQRLSLALSTIRGAAARDGAFALGTAMNAATGQDAQSFSLAGCLQSLVTYVPDENIDALLESATAADRVWAALGQPPPTHVRVKNWLESLTEVRLGGGIRMVPLWCADEPSVALSFDDSFSAPLSLDTLAAALDIGDETLEKNMRSAGNRVHVTASLASALTDYVSSRTQRATRAWPQPLEAAPVRAPGMQFSASRLNAYVKCPRRWFYDYLCQALDDPPSLHAAYGRVVHDALEALHREIRLPSRYDPPIISERLLRHLDVAFGKSRTDFSSQLEYEVSRCRARRMAEQYVRWLTLEATRAPMEIIGVELFVRQRFGNHDFVGYVDRIDRPVAGGPVTIFDYKTGRLDTDASEYLAKVRRGDEAQLALYYAMRRAAGDEIARVALVSIRDPRDEAWILALDIVDDDGKEVILRDAQAGVVRAACSRADLDASLAALLARCDFLTTQGHEHFPVGDDPPCNYCAYASACRDKPATGERIFAR